MPEETSPALNHSPRAILQRLESLQAAGVMNLPKGHYVPSAESIAEPQAVAAAPLDREKTLGRGKPLGRGKTLAAEQSPAVQQAIQRATQSDTIPLDPSQSQPATPPAATPKREPLVSMPVATEAVQAAPSLEILQQQVTGCTACGELSSTRTQTVFGVGNANAQLCFLGEAPGADEDRLGEPFVGKAGQLLTKIIEACQMTRSEVYILNVLKCRPPGNRNPTTQEATACTPYLNRQLDLIGPEFVCCLGAVAAQNFLETDKPIGRLRGRVHEHRGLKVICTYHPAYLLRNPSAKRATWDDMKLLMRAMGRELS